MIVVAHSPPFFEFQNLHGQDPPLDKSVGSGRSSAIFLRQVCVIALDHAESDFLANFATAGESRRERLQYDPSGPPRDPFTSHSAARDRPYGGGPPPRNPFVPGGDLYDYEREVGRRHPSIEPNLSRFDDQQRRRHNHYRSRVGEPWGIADFQNYQGRRRHEERVRRRSRRDEERGLLDI